VIGTSGGGIARKRRKPNHEGGERMQSMSEKKVTDEQILTQRKFPRRSFLTAAGALLAGAAAVASGVRVSAQEKATDPDSKDKPKKTAKKSSKMGMKKGSDPDKKKSSKAKAKPAAAPKSDPDGSRF
jgi:hypothetical protein